jgi:hypothetical protein
MQHIIVISDGTGGTAKRLLDAALVQFPEHESHISVRPDIRTTEQIQVIMSEAEAKGSFIVHTMATEEMRVEILRLGKLHNIETIDMMGSLLARLSSQFDISPTSKPGLFTRLNSDYFRRIEAVEFAIKHDDGKRVNDLEDAEFVLLGVSRTFKTPLSIYMSFMGWHTANVPIILGITPPDVLEKLNSKRVYCLQPDHADCQSCVAQGRNILEAQLVITQQYRMQQESLNMRRHFIVNIQDGH